MIKNTENYSHSNSAVYHTQQNGNYEVLDTPPNGDSMVYLTLPNGNSAVLDTPQSRTVNKAK